MIQDQDQKGTVISSRQPVHEIQLKNYSEEVFEYGHSELQEEVDFFGGAF